jgi:pimeloyl-ACP methyl ester carboxylesterase
MPHADNHGVRIHYQVEGSGPPLVLQHGFLQSVEDWQERGYVDALKGNHRLILVDARGHGRSDKPHDVASYRLEHRASDVVAVLDALGIEKADFWGYSMGGWIGFGVAEYARDRLSRLVIGGAHPYANSQVNWRELLSGGISKGHVAFLETFEQMIGTIASSWRARLQRADFEALLASVSEDRVSHEAVLSQIAVPACLYAGDADPRFAEAKFAAEAIRGGAFLSLPGLDHLQAFVRSDRVLPRVTAFFAARV